MPKTFNKSHPNRMPPGVPHPVDIHVGGRVREQRKLKGMSQGELGDSLGLTFQQIQKYERGANRIGASRLFQLSQILDVPVAYFFDGMPANIRMTQENFDLDMTFAEDPRDSTDVMGSSETTELVTAYYGIGNARKRRAVHDLIASLSKADWE
ncbi:MAG: transcriptional regulator [Rhodospirillales bacterium CG15_BIG_FIL_POST_REV_8_21_14_020_66_15]|nr:MAG: transcriptional regulator [Rhodospirillales bacterium CG15_BIG_FIL_POST_REV_8_21_14_020_66_15]